MDEPASRFLPTLQNLQRSGPEQRPLISAALEKLSQHLSVQKSEDAFHGFEERYMRSWLTGLIVLLTASDRDDDPNVDSAARLLARISGPSAQPAHVHRFVFQHACSQKGAQELIIRLRIETLVGDKTGDSTGVKVWPAGEHMATQVARQPSRFGLGQERPSPRGIRSIRSMELGSGTGLLGITIAAIMCRQGIEGEMVLTDNDHFTLANLRHNVHSNQHLWAATGDIRVTVCHLDWRFSRDLLDSEKYDIVFGSDLVYDVEHAELLRQTLERLMRRATGIAFLMITLRPTHTKELDNIAMAFGQDCPLALRRHAVQQSADATLNCQLLEISWA